MSDAPLLQVEDLARHYTLPRERLLGPAPVVRAVDGVSFTLAAGRSLGLVGESGSGKSTLARLVMALEPPSAGRVRLAGRDLATLPPAALRAARRDFQMVFQDPYGSLDPRLPVARIVAEPIVAQGAGERGAALRARLADVLGSVGLREADLDKYPHEFSGGQRQRIAIARALVTKPRLIVADEPVSALDVSVQAQVLNLLQDLQAAHGLSYLLISHDLAVVERICDEVAVMYRGRIVEQAPAAALFARPAHPYTQALLDAVPAPVPGRRRRTGATGATGAPLATGTDVPATRTVRGRSPSASGPPAPSPAPPPAPASGPPTGCAYADRCPVATDRCRAEVPMPSPVGDGHRAACHHPHSVPLSFPLGFPLSPIRRSPP